MSTPTSSRLWTRKFSVVLLFLIFITIFPTSALAGLDVPKGKGPFFIYQPGTKWSIGGLGFHNGCKNQSCHDIDSFDYIAAWYTPMRAPFSGKITASCLKPGNQYLSYLLTAGEVLIKFQSDDGLWEIGSLHVATQDESGNSLCFPEGTHINYGEVFGYVGDNGNSQTPHNHLWIRSLSQGVNLCDHDWFWNGGALGLLPGTQPNVGCTQTTTMPTAEALANLSTSVVSTAPPPVALYSKTYHISKHAGGMRADGNYNWPNYAYNMRQFFYFVDHGNPNERRTATGMYDHDDKLINFSGSYTFYANQTTWLNGVAGAYFPSEGMRISEVGGVRQGGGACNTASMVVEVLAAASCKISNTSAHPTIIPEIDYPALHSIAVSTYSDVADPNQKNGGDAKIVCPQDTTLRWDLSGDNITLTAIGGTLQVLATTNPSSPNSTTPTSFYQPVGKPPVLVDYNPNAVIFTTPPLAVVEQVTSKPKPAYLDMSNYATFNPDGSFSIKFGAVFKEFGWLLIAVILAGFGLYFINSARKNY